MVDPAVVAPVQSYLRELAAQGIPVAFGVLTSSALIEVARTQGTTIAAA